MFIHVCGPDEVGKSTLCDRLVNAYQKSYYHHRLEWCLGSTANLIRYEFNHLLKLRKAIHFFEEQLMSCSMDAPCGDYIPHLVELTSELTNGEWLEPLTDKVCYLCDIARSANYFTNCEKNVLVTRYVLCNMAYQCSYKDMSLKPFFNLCRCIEHAARVYLPIPDMYLLITDFTDKKGVRSNGEPHGMVKTYREILKVMYNNCKYSHDDMHFGKMGSHYFAYSPFNYGMNTHFFEGSINVKEYNKEPFPVSPCRVRPLHSIKEWDESALKDLQYLLVGIKEP